MENGRNLSEEPQSVDSGAVEPQAIPLDQAAALADEVEKLIKVGEAGSAWERIRDLHPADIGTIVAGLPRRSRDTLLQVMSPQTVAWALRQMNPIEAGRVGVRIGSGMLSFLLNQVNPEQARDALARLPVRRAREIAETLEQPLDDAEFLKQTPDTAGSLMTTRFPAVDRTGRAAEARDSLRALGEERQKFTHVFVLGNGGFLSGQVAMVDLALAEDDTPVHTIETPVVATVPVDARSEECARLQKRYNLDHLPVVDGRRLVGVIPVESLLSAAVEQGTRQMLQVANVAGETIGGPLASSIRARLPWLTVNLGTTFLAAATITLFESTLSKVVVLAAFLPVVAGQGGIGGTQTLTLIVRAIALGELVGIGARRLLAREAALGLAHGVWLGALVAVIALLWKQNIGLSLVLGIAMLGNMIIAGTVGAGVPFFLRRVGVDPAVASAVVVTTFTDVFGFLLFLGIATASINLIL